MWFDIYRIGNVSALDTVETGLHIGNYIKKAHLLSLLCITTSMVELSISPPVAIAVWEPSQECIENYTCRTKLCLKKAGEGARRSTGRGTGWEKPQGG